MLSHLKTLSKDTIIYGLGSAIGNLISFLLIPYYTNHLNTSDYGYLNLLVTIQAIIEIIAVFGFNSGFLRYYLMAGNESQKEKVLNSSIMIQSIFMLSTGVVFYILSKMIAVVFIKDESLTYLVRIVVITAIFNAGLSLLFAYLRALRETVKFTVLQFVRIFFMIILNIVMISYLGMKYEGIILSKFYIAGATFILMIVLFARKVTLKIDYKLVKKILVFSYPILLANVFSYLLTLSDRFFLNHFITIADVGIYSFASKISAILKILVITPFSIAVIPYALSIANNDDFKTVFAKIIKYYVIILFSIGLIYLYFSKELVEIIASSSYLESWRYIAPLSLGHIFYGIYYAISVQLDIAEKTYYSTIVVAISGIASLVLNYLLIPVMGINGSVLSNVIANMLLFIIMYYFAQKMYNITYPVKSFILFGLYIALFILLYFGLEYFVDDPYVYIIGKLIAAVCYLMLILFSGAFSKSERKIILNKINKVYKK